VRIIHSGLFCSIDERLDQLDRLGELLRLEARTLDSEISTRRSAGELFEIERALSISRIASAPIAAVKLSCPNSSCAFKVLVLGQQLAVLERRQARLQHDVVFEVEDALQSLSVIVEQETDAVGSDSGTRCARPAPASSIWPMRSRRTRDSVTSTPHFSQMMPFVLHALVLAAQALVIP